MMMMRMGMILFIGKVGRYINVRRGCGGTAGEERVGCAGYKNSGRAGILIHIQYHVTSRWDTRFSVLISFGFISACKRCDATAVCCWSFILSCTLNPLRPVLSKRHGNAPLILSSITM